ncbi:enoyl-CoA hydratase/isomerase family protein [Sediminimonas qiaohouensis]|uniref:enoyl-CoA hydratase/isomerase family protein n=1 Tax=Sediminimonas qiaohouensis TaxID=552061 RepID=UPI00041A730E|nr:enoyl-CoA hydratase/isomerase family protein [Sediminimonas qiaohouensis]
MTEESAEIDIRTQGRAGRITLNRPKALNALTYDMCLRIEAALDAWRDDAAVDLLIIDAAGDKAFCAGGDIAELYRTGKAGDYVHGRRFWADEYRMNAKLFEFPKPVVSLMQGFVMGGGVGVGCHGSHRIVDTNAQIAMPECGIGLVPDVGGSLLLARAPGRVGEYLGLTAARMSAGDAIFAGFADACLPRDAWPDLIADLCAAGDIDAAERPCAEAPPASDLSTQMDNITAHFGGERLDDILRSLQAQENEFTAAALKQMGRNSPLSMGCTVEMIHRLRGPSAEIRRALDLEYRFTFRSMDQGDFLEGVRAAIIDKDRNPHWKHTLHALPDVAVSQMLLPLGDDALTLEEKTT